MSTSESAFSVDPEIMAMISRARIAQAEFEGFSQEQVDGIVRDIAKYVYDNAEELSRMAIDETGIGRYEDHPSLDFSRVEREPDVHFAHKSGFMCKTSATESARLKQLIALAWKH